MIARTVRMPVPRSWVADFELDRAVGVDGAGHLLVLGATAAPLVQGHAQAVADRPRAVLAARLALLAPADQLGPHLDLALVDRGPEVAGGQVLEPELQRVDPQLVGQVVHGRFHQAQPWGWPGARMARAPPQLTNTSVWVRDEAGMS